MICSVNFLRDGTGDTIFNDRHDLQFQSRVMAAFGKLIRDPIVRHWTHAANHDRLSSTRADFGALDKRTFPNCAERSKLAVRSS